MKKILEICFGLVLLMTSGLGCLAQDVNSRFENGQFFIELDKTWTSAERAHVVKQYQLDSALVANVLKGSGGTSQTVNGEKWTVKKIDANRFELSKSLESLEQGEDWGRMWTSDPEQRLPTNGPGYVDQSKVVFGSNDFKKNTFILEGAETIKLVFPSAVKAGEVVVTGSFNNWSTSGIPMKQGPNGWEVSLRLKPGKYYYKYIVDGTWTYDKGNNLKEDDGYGSYNSVFYVTNKRFVLKGYNDASSVVLSGSFNGWNPKDVEMKKGTSGWYVDVYLGDGTHTYKYIVDGNWITDPANPKRLPNGIGDYNSVIAQGDAHLFKLRGYTSAKQVVLAGSFNGWREDELQMKRTDSGWEFPYVLAPGNYEYRFIVDGTWVSDPSNAYRIYRGDHDNSFLAVSPNHTFLLDGYPVHSKVIVTGSFSGWSEENNVMVRSGEVWKFPIHLAPGKYHYKFIINGEWTVDPANPYYEDNEFGSGNSVLWIED
jgi:hypothetical protein